MISLPWSSGFNARIICIESEISFSSCPGPASPTVDITDHLAFLRHKHSHIRTAKNSTPTNTPTRAPVILPPNVRGLFDAGSSLIRVLEAVAAGKVKYVLAVVSQLKL